MEHSVNLRLFKTLYRRVIGSPYKLGSKWPLGADSAKVRGTPVDCSGFVRWILDRCGVRLPDGSQAQWTYVRDVLGWREVRYRDMEYSYADPTRLFIAFKRATKSGHGHVWLVRGGWTIESASNIGGVGSVPWQTRRRIAAACYEVPV